MEALNWREEVDGAFVAGAYQCEATVYFDEQDPQNKGWAYRVRLWSGNEESGPCDSPEDGRAICQGLIWPPDETSEK